MNLTQRWLPGALCLLILWGPWCLSFANGQQTEALKRPNLVFAIADDWGWPHASAYGDEALATPNFDFVARQGVLFHHAYISSPSCTPSRGAIITGQDFWRLGQAANLWSAWPANEFPEYPALLEASGYFTGHFRKAWGPGQFENQPAGQRYKSVQAFFEARPADQPFCFWFGASDPHRGYKYGSGKESGIDLSRVHLFPHFPDTEVVRNDVADYYFEVQRFDRDLGNLIQRLQEMGEFENTIIVVTGDHGMPFPRCKGHLYDSGSRVPLAICGPGIVGERQVNSLVSLTDVAPTFLDFVGEPIPESMTGRSLRPLLESGRSGRAVNDREFIVFGRERHTVSQERGIRGGYPMRAIRTHSHLYIHNFMPDRWPAGTPDFDNAEFKRAWLSDCDNGPTKTEIWEQRESENGKRLYELSFGKRPAEELYDLAADPDQLVNVAGQPMYRQLQDHLANQLQQYLIEKQDPRAQNPQSTLDESGRYRGGGGGQWPGK